LSSSTPASGLDDSVILCVDDDTPVPAQNSRGLHSRAKRRRCVILAHLSALSSDVYHYAHLSHPRRHQLLISTA
jgi:hypothetical protein